jgi:hypothetical protein
VLCDPLTPEEKRSIPCPDYKEAGVPLWGIQYWIEMDSMLRIETLWQGCLDWLARHSNVTQENLDESCALLLTLPWTVQLCVLRLQASTCLCALGGVTYTSADNLTRILSDRMVSTSLVDFMIEEIAAQVQSDPMLSKKYKIINLTFISEIQKVNNEEYWDKESPPYLHQLEEKLRGSNKCLEFPIYLEAQVHFNAFKIDYGRQEICYGGWFISLNSRPQLE